MNTRKRRFSTFIVPMILALSFWLNGCARMELAAPESSPPFAPNIHHAAIRLEVPLHSETLLDRYGVGSGFLVFSDIGVTCAHVLNGRLLEKPIRAFWANKEHQVEILGVDEALDVAVFRIAIVAHDMSPLPKSTQIPMTGESVRVAGFPLSSVILDKAPTLSAGIISSVDRSILFEGRQIDGLIQLDAVASEGSSGSLVATLDGRVIGMVVFAATGRKAEWRGAAFALPIEVVELAAKSIVEESEKSKKAHDHNQAFSRKTTAKSLITK